MRIRILYHDHCFDGAASAAIFSRFMEGVFHPHAEFAYTGMAHKASQMFAADPRLTGKERMRAARIIAIIAIILAVIVFILDKVLTVQQGGPRLRRRY